MGSAFNCACARSHAAERAAAETPSSRSGECAPTSVQPKMIPMHRIATNKVKTMNSHGAWARRGFAWCTAPFECGASKIGGGVDSPDAGS